MHNTHIEALEAVHGSVLDLIRAMNSPRAIAGMLREAGVDLDRALVPLLVRIEREGPIGVVELAGWVGRDYTTVSRQLAKLQALGLVCRRPARADRRIRAVEVTSDGRAVTASLRQARHRLYAPLLADWSTADRTDLIRLIRKLADETLAFLQPESELTDLPE